MQTGSITYRVADFLKQYPPFQSMDEDDLIDLAGHGRVKFHEIDEFILWQGAKFPPWIFVVQQGTVSIWEETGGAEHLVDIRGAGDIVGIDRYHGFTENQHSVKAASDVVLYALPADRFGELLKKYPAAEKYIAAHASVSDNYLAQEARRGAFETYVYDMPSTRRTVVCYGEDTIQHAAAQMNRHGTSAMIVLGSHEELLGVLTARDILRATSEGELAPLQTVSRWMHRHPPILEPTASVADCVLAIAEHNSDIAVIAERGRQKEDQYRVVGLFELAPAFGDHPIEILHEIHHAAGIPALRLLNQRARAFAADRLISPAGVDWLSMYLHRVDIAILARLRELHPPPDPNFCWSLFGSAGRREMMAPVQPRAVLVLPQGADEKAFAQWFAQINDEMVDAGYFHRGLHFVSDYSAATVGQWTERFTGWIQDPIKNHIQSARHMFDLRGVHGNTQLWEDLRTQVRAVMGRSETFLRVMAHDCLANLPPLTFFRDAVVDESGVRSKVFDLQGSALRPLVDVGRVYGIASGHTLGTSTLERFRMAKRLLPEQDKLFREVSDTFRVVLYLQARNGIRQGDGGNNIDPAMLSHHEQQLLKSGFRSIHRLLEFTAEGAWMERSR